MSRLKRIEKRCPGCSNTFPISHFRGYKLCVGCNRGYMRGHRTRSWLKSQYGITVEEYQQMFENQEGKCLLCDITPGEQAFCVDHDHATGVVRGLLCRQCNAGLGHFHDSLKLLRKAAKYIESTE